MSHNDTWFTLLIACLIASHTFSTVVGQEAGDSRNELSSLLMAAPSRLNRDLARGRIEPAGEDVAAGQGSAASAERLKLITERMQLAGTILAEEDVSGRASSTQQEVVTELDAMLAQLQKECEDLGGQCSKPGQAQPTATTPSARPGASPGEATATAATSETAKATAAATAERAAIGKLVNDLWGKLPERQREELLQPLSEEFLPEYAADIEEYFRVLAESAEPDAAETKP